MIKYCLSFLFALISLCSCDKDDALEGTLLSKMDISDAKELYIEVSYVNLNSSGGEKYSLYKIRHDGSVARVPVLSETGREIEMVNMGIAHYNSESIIFRYAPSHYLGLVYLINKRTGKATRLNKDMEFLQNASQDCHTGIIRHCNDKNDNFYYSDIAEGGKTQICKYTKDAKKEILSNGYDVGGEFAVDWNGNMIAQIHKETWLYRAVDGTKKVLQISNLLYSDNMTADIFAIKGRSGFYYMRTIGTSSVLSMLEYDDVLGTMKSTDISNDIRKIHPSFYGVYYSADKTLLISNNGVVIIDVDGGISYKEFEDADMNHFKKTRNSFSWFFNSLTTGRRFNIESQEIEELYSLSDYVVEAVTNEVDGKVTVYGLNMQTGKKVSVRVENGMIVSEVPWDDEKVRKLSYWLEM